MRTIPELFTGVFDYENNVGSYDILATDPDNYFIIDYHECKLRHFISESRSLDFGKTKAMLAYISHLEDNSELLFSISAISLESARKRISLSLPHPRDNMLDYMIKSQAYKKITTEYLYSTDVFLESLKIIETDRAGNPRFIYISSPINVKDQSLLMAYSSKNKYIHKSTLEVYAEDLAMLIGKPSTTNVKNMT